MSPGERRKNSVNWIDASVCSLGVPQQVEQLRVRRFENVWWKAVQSHNKPNPKITGWFRVDESKLTGRVTAFAVRQGHNN
jgi:hypothetical protein